MRSRGDHLEPAFPSAQTAPDWVARSNAHTRVVLEAQAKLAPEGAAQVGVSGVDDQITDLSPGYTQRVRESVTKTQEELQRRLKAEKDPLVRQSDLLATIRQRRRDSTSASGCSCPTPTPRRDFQRPACSTTSAPGCRRAGGRAAAEIHGRGNRLQAFTDLARTAPRAA